MKHFIVLCVGLLVSIAMLPSVSATNDEVGLPLVIEIRHAPGADHEKDILAALHAVMAGEVVSAPQQTRNEGEDYTKCYYYSSSAYRCCTYYANGTSNCTDYRYECHYYGSGGYRYARGNVSSHCGWRATPGPHQCTRMA